MKVRLSVKPMYEHCEITRRRERVMVTCSADPEHKQYQE